MDFQFLFVNFQGRIGRTVFRIGAVVLLAMFLGISFLIVIQTRGFELGRGFALAMVQLLFLHPACALMAKRLHDRGYSAYPLVVVAAPIVVERYRYLRNLFAGEPGPETLDYFLWGIALAAAVWLLIELGFLPGTAGPNRYGPNPFGDSR